MVDCKFCSSILFALATPDYLVDEMWDRTFLRSPFVTLWGIISTKFLNKEKETN